MIPFLDFVTSGWDAAKLLTLGVAGYAATLSTIVFVTQQRERRPRVRVSFAYGQPVRFQGMPAGLMPANTLIVEAANVGRQVVSLASCGIVRPDARWHPLHVVHPADPDALWIPTFPYKLEPGTHVTVSRDVAALARTLADAGFTGVLEIVGVYRDETGREFRSKPMQFNIDGWLPREPAIE